MSRRTNARAWLLIIAMLGTPPAVAYLVTHPDVVTRARMRAALAVKAIADDQAAFWSDVSARAATAYQRARL
jgi:hypothetical protein